MSLRLVGGIVGSICGVIGGLIGTYFSIKNTKSPRERAFVIKASIGVWIFVLAFVLGMYLLPGLYKLFLIPIYAVGLVIGILLLNKRQARLRFEMQIGQTKDKSAVPPNPMILRKCPQCGAELKPDVPEGLCPACLLQRGIATEGGAPPGTPPFTPPPFAELAKLFPQLEILESIGQGGMGAVYKARQPALDRLVALKILAPRSGGDVDFAERFTREARALAKLNHPNIVAVYDFGTVARASRPFDSTEQHTGETPVPLHYFIMEYVDGLNLRQIEQVGKLQPREALQIVPQICGALQFAHDEGIVHRDIKPENILLDKKGRVKIADFGLAKIVGLEAKDFRLTGARDVMGTPHYMAPEQVEHPQAVDHRADIYSLGVVFYEMLTGELPLGKFAPPSQKIHMDVRLDEVVLRSLEKEPSRRYQQASDVKTDVETITSSKSDSRPGVRRKKPILPFVLGAGIVCVLLVAALFIFHQNVPKTLTIHAFIDGSDVFYVSGNKLWIEHEKFELPGKTIDVNHRPWTPTWSNNISSEFTGLKPAFKPHNPQTIQVTKMAGRGTVSVEQLPSADNAQTLAVRINDDDYGGADWYDVVISWDGPKSGNSNVTEQIQKSTGSNSIAQSAMPAVQAWLKLMDDGDYGKSWETAAASFHEAVTKAEWVAKSKEIREPLGKVLSRKLSSTEQPTTIPGIPDRAYFVAKFDTAFANFKPATETVTFALTDDNQWKSIAYLIQPDTNEKEPVVGSAEKPAITTDQVLVEHAAMHVLAAIRDKDDAALKTFATDDCVKGWRDSLPEFAFELRENFHQFTGKPFDLHISESQVHGDKALVKCDGTAALNGKYLVLFFVKTADGWKNCYLHNGLPPTRLEDWWKKFPDKKSYATEAKAEDAAVSAAKKWLALIDAGNYSQTWQEASVFFRDAVKESAWKNSMDAFRKPLGDLKSRKLESAKYATQLPGAPDGHYVVMQFETSFADKKSAIETVTFMREKDGQWRAAGYFIK